jgi:hypothetical protein
VSHLTSLYQTRLEYQHEQQSVMVLHRARLSRSEGLLPEGRDPPRSNLMEEKMRVLPLHELMHLNRIKLCDLAAPIRNAWPDLPDGSEAPANGLINLRLIRRVLARHAPEPF